MTTEHSEATPFDAFCRPGALLSPEIVADLVAATAEQLGDAHRNGIVHGDIRPSNLLRVGRAGVRILGLGEQPTESAVAGQGGIPDYLSPERVRGSAADSRSDLFALGGVLFEMLTGEKPFPGDSESSILYRIVHEPVRDLRTFDPPVVEELHDVVQRALAKRADRRFATGEALADAIRAAVIAQGVEQAIGSSLSGEVSPVRATASPIVDPPANEVRIPPPTNRTSGRSSSLPYIVAAIILIAVVAATIRFVRGPSSSAESVPPPEVWLETLVTTEPADLEVQLDGLPLDPANGGVVKFRSREPWGTLTASYGCRTAEHTLGPEDAGGELVLVVDPVEIDWRVDPAVDGAAILLNGAAAGATPADLRFDLCKDNRLELRAKGYRPALVEIAAGATPLDARTRLTELTLVPIPKGRVILPRPKGVQLVYYVDGKRLRSSPTDVELEEGAHKIRIKNEYHWIDDTKSVRVVGGKTVEADFGRIAFADLAVQAFPSNCKVYLRRPGGRWRYMDETPASRRVATGRFQVKVELNPTGETNVRDIELQEGDNPPVRFSFRGGG